jgi:D-amino peptidase
VRVHVISDMEGVAGITKWEQVMGGEPLYEEGRRLYTGETNAAVRGAFAAGASEVVVMDCHGAGKGWNHSVSCTTHVLSTLELTLSVRRR